MAHVVILGAGRGGVITAVEIKEQLGSDKQLTVIPKDPKYLFVPSNPWIAVNWHGRKDVGVDLAPVLAKKGIVKWSSSGKWVRGAKIAFEKYFLRKTRKGTSETLCEKAMLHTPGINKLKKVRSF